MFKIISVCLLALVAGVLFFASKQPDESRISRSEVEFDQAIEVHFDEDDSSVIRVTGFPTINRKFLKEHGLSITVDESDSGLV